MILKILFKGDIANTDTSDESDTDESQLSMQKSEIDENDVSKSNNLFILLNNLCFFFIFLKRAIFIQNIEIPINLLRLIIDYFVYLPINDLIISFVNLFSIRIIQFYYLIYFNIYKYIFFNFYLFIRFKMLYNK